MSKIVDTFDRVTALSPNLSLDLSLDLSVTHPGSRRISAETITTYLNSFRNENDRAFAKKVLEATRYVSQEEFIGALNNSFTQFEEKIGDRPFVVYLPSAKFGSETIFTLRLWSRIRQLNFQGFVTCSDDPSADPYTGITCVVEGGSHVLVIDDAIYCGNNVLGCIDEITYNNRDRHSKQNPIYFHLVIPFVSNIGRKTISEFTASKQFPNVSLYPMETMIPLREQWSGYTEELMNRFQLEFMCQVPIYFDHKVACEFSTFEPIYMRGFVPEKGEIGMLLPSKPDTDLKSRLYRKYFIDTLRPPK